MVDVFQLGEFKMRLAALCAPIAALTFAIPAQAALITFEEPGLVGMPNSPGAVVPPGSQLSDFFLPTLGVSFSSGADFVAVVDHYPPDPDATPTPPSTCGRVRPRVRTGAARGPATARGSSWAAVRARCSASPSAPRSAPPGPAPAGCPPPSPAPPRSAP